MVPADTGSRSQFWVWVSVIETGTEAGFIWFKEFGASAEA